MSLFKREKKTEKMKNKTPTEQSRITMLTTWGEQYYAWNGKLYESDIVRACIRPKVKAIGKLVGNHIREDQRTKQISMNPDARIRFLLQEPNPLMTGQQMQEKIANQLCLNNNAFVLKIYDANGLVVQLYPIPCVSAEARYNDNGELFLKFNYFNGKSGTFRYTDIIHLRGDYNTNDIFGDSPAPALSQMMNVIGTIDQGIIKAIKNSGIVQWLLKYTQSMREEDIKKNAENFVKNYLSLENESLGVVAADAKAEVQRIEPKDYVPNAAQQDRVIDRVYSFLNTNKKIVQSNYTENDWNAYYEAEIEPIVIQLGDTYTQALFSRRERGCGNKIEFAADNLACATLQTKLSFQAMVDRGAMTPNEWRKTMNLAPLPGGDEPIRRLDTQVVNMVESALDKLNEKNYSEIADMIKSMLSVAEGREENGTDQCEGTADTKQL